MDTLFFSTHNEHYVLGMYLLTPIVLMFGLSLLADLFSVTRRLAHVHVNTINDSHQKTQAVLQKHSRLKKNVLLDSEQDKQLDPVKECNCESASMKNNEKSGQSQIQIISHC